MANFKTQIENIAGKTATVGATGQNAYNEMINNFLKQSARAVLNLMPDDVLIRDSIKTNITSDSGITVTDKKVVKVTRAGHGCIEMPLEEKAHLQANSGSIKEPTKRSPVYYIEGQITTGGFLFIKPDPTATEQGQLDFNLYPSPLYNEDSIDNFPDRAEYAVVIGSAIRLLQHKINKMIHEDEDIELTSVAQQELQTVTMMYQDEIARLNGSAGMAQPQQGGE